MTVLFADIVGSTELAEALDPEDWREIVGGAHQRVSEAVHRLEGHVAQLLGDGVLAFFGAPLAHEDDAERAVRAALAILDATRQYAAELRPRRLPREFQMRIGINTGQVVVGNIGSDLHLEYLAVGDTVNLAARVESASEPDSILITENTCRLLGSLFALEDQGLITVKGKAEPVRVFRVLGDRKGATRARGIAGLYSPMVGRQRELLTLLRVSADLHAGRGGIVSILGEAGLGKTRLVREWRQALEAEASSTGNGSSPAADHPPIRWAIGRSLSYGGGVAYQLALEVMRSLLGVGADTPPEAVRATLRRSCERLLPGEANEVYPPLALMMGLPLEEDAAARMRYLEGPALKARYIAASKAYLKAVARQTPTVIVAEDVHWADPSSVDLGVQVIAAAAEAPLVFVLVSRPDREAPGWRLITAAREVPGVGSVELHLAPLTERDSEQLVNNLLEVAALPDNVRALILNKAEGNPFYVEEVIRMLIDHGGLRREGNRWEATGDIKAIAIPDTLQGVIMARIDRLPEEAKRALQVASVIGRRFQVEVLETVLGGSNGRRV